MLTKCMQKFSFQVIFVLRNPPVSQYLTLTALCIEKRIYRVTNIRVGQPKNRCSIRSQRKMKFSFYAVSKPTLIPTSGLFTGSRNLFVQKQRSGRTSEHSTPTSTQVKNSWIYTSTLLFIFIACCLIRDRNRITLVHREQKL